MIINDQIRFQTVRVSDPNGNSLGIISIEEAKRIAEVQGLDLVLITEKANPPVCRILDSGKYRYEIQKKEKETRKKQAESKIETKEIRLRPVTDIHDIEIKSKRAMEFLEKGYHVKISVRFKGRELSNKEIGHDIIQKMFDMLGDIRYIKKVTFEGRTLSALIAKGDK